MFEEAPVESYYQEVILEEGDKCSRQELAIYDMPSNVVVVKCPTKYGELVNGSYKKICDYLIFDLWRNAVILCELKKTYHGKPRNNAIEQIWDTKELVQNIIAEMEVHCEIGKINRKIKEHYMMFSSEKKRMDIRPTHKNAHDKKLKLHCFIGLSMSYNQIKKTIRCKYNYNDDYKRIELITFV
ncbi:MAG: hypothetical protein ACNYPH_06005 [Gammaproteobacteria bacterium WSBS_2016_MAG_OTU1]